MSSGPDRASFEAVISDLTRPVNGQLPRPWMTDLRDPSRAKVFIVGQNQAKGYDAARLSHQRHLDALFNRNGESCRKVYDEMTGGRPSPTRRNIVSLRRMLEVAGVSEVLETNVVCYSTPMSRDLHIAEHKEGASTGSIIFRTLLRFIQPLVLIAHGAGTSEALGKILTTSLPAAGYDAHPPVSVETQGMAVFVIPSLAPPAWNRWSSWAPRHMQEVAEGVKSKLVEARGLRGAD